MLELMETIESALCGQLQAVSLPALEQEEQAQTEERISPPVSPPPLTAENESVTETVVAEQTETETEREMETGKELSEPLADAELLAVEIFLQAAYEMQSDTFRQLLTAFASLPRARATKQHTGDVRVRFHIIGNVRA